MAGLGSRLAYALGESFGELGLLTSEPRAATIECDTDVAFVTIVRRDYDKILADLQSNQYEATLQCLKEISALQLARASSMVGLCYVAR